MKINYFHIQTIIILIHITVGYVVWTYNSKSNLNKILALIIVCTLLLEFSYLFHLKMEGKRILLGSVLLGSLGISFFPPLFYTLSLYYPMKKDFKPESLVMVYALALALSLAIIFSFPSSYIVRKPVSVVDLNDMSFSNLPYVFISLYFLLTSFSVVLLILTARHFLSSFHENIIPYEKSTLRLLILIGIPLAYILSIVSVINYFFNIPFPWISFLLVIFTLFLVILIFRFHIVDLRRLLSGVLIFPSIIAILVFLYISIVLKNQKTIAGVLSLPEGVVLALEVLIIYLAVSTLRRFLDISFIRKRFPRVSPLGGINIEPLEYLSYSMTVKGLNRRLQQVLRTYTKTENNLMLLLNPEKKVFESLDHRRAVSIPASSEMLRPLLKLNRGVTLEELLLYLNNRKDIAMLYEQGFDLVLPINRGNEIIALILLPGRGIFRRWSYEDIHALNYLKTIMPSLIDRCRMYENEKEIEKHQYRMEQLIVMGEMASGLAHEIRNPLSIISTSVETLLREDVSTEDRVKMLQYIQEETNRINILANKLLSINFQRKPELEQCNIVAIFQKLQSFLSYQLKDRKITFQIKNEEPLWLNTDPNILFQVLLNLTLNSIEAIGNRGVIAIDYSHNGTDLFLFVEDDGAGIPARIRDKIFEPFFTTKKKGTGLGLTVTKKLIENLFGSIKLMPSKKGTKFKITLPILNVSE
ncbi:MAG: sensor histidine kinase [Spirochaetota bacterium]